MKLQSCISCIAQSLMILSVLIASLTYGFPGKGSQNVYNANGELGCQTQARQGLIQKSRDARSRSRSNVAVLPNVEISNSDGDRGFFNRRPGHGLLDGGESANWMEKEKKKRLKEMQKLREKERKRKEKEEMKKRQREENEKKKKFEQESKRKEQDNKNKEKEKEREKKQLAKGLLKQLEKESTAKVKGLLKKLMKETKEKEKEEKRKEKETLKLEQQVNKVLQCIRHRGKRKCLEKLPLGEIRNSLDLALSEATIIDLFPEDVRTRLENGGKITLVELNTFLNERGRYRSRPEVSSFDLISIINQGNDLTDLFQGDIMIEKRESEVGGAVKRDAQRARQFLWKTRIIPYVVSKELESAAGLIVEAMQEIAQATCLKFVKRTTEANWIEFVEKTGCWSSVGKAYWRQGPQSVSLGDGCLYHGTIVHEVMHALGFWHEQSRPDRDQYIEIFWENIKPAEIFNFRRISAEEVDVLDAEYDYGSVMHYGATSHSANGKATIKPIKGNFTLGQKKGLSPIDVIQINRLYRCQELGNGQAWSGWSGYSPCNEACLKQRQRFCTKVDLKECPGADQFGVQSESVPCTQAECKAPVDGHWNRWSTWASCDKACGWGTRKRTRSCDDPKPQNGGKNCAGVAEDTSNCMAIPCSKGVYDCLFDADQFCHWVNGETNNARFTWKLQSGATPSSGTGPSQDHGSAGGRYVFVEASLPAEKGDSASLVSTILDGGHVRCMTFWYHMNGVQMGSLSVYVEKAQGSIKLLKWQMSGDQGNEWKKGSLALVEPDNHRVVFEAIRGNDYQSDIALDDITFVDGLGDCKLVPVKPAIKEKQVQKIGCFNDFGYVNSKRPFPYYKNLRAKIVWTNLQLIVDECLLYVKEHGYKYFGIEYYGECWTGPSDQVNYARDGSTEDCYKEVGKDWTMMVYKYE